MNQPNSRPKTIREILGMDQEPDAFPIVPPEKLEEITQPDKDTSIEIPITGEIESSMPDAKTDAKIAPKILELTQTKPIRKIFSREVIRYPVIFLMALVFFYGLLNFRALFSQISSLVDSPPKNTEAVLGANTQEYSFWIQKYYVYVANPEALAPNEDADVDNLTNFDEFYLGTNPLNPDTDGDFSTDGNEVLSGDNPLYTGKLTEKQKQIIKDNIKPKDIESRQDFNIEKARAITRPDSKISALPLAENFLIDTSKAGQISIPRLGVSAPITWSKDFARMEDDLKYGTAHHPSTPYPGEKGLPSIHGHSSGNFSDGNFKTIFNKLNFLEPGDDVFITVYSVAGGSRRYRYVARSKQVYEKTDPVQFASQGAYNLNLSTSWPIGTARQRYVVTTELAGL